jgi:hypothetical protein
VTRGLKLILKRAHFLCATWFFDPLELVQKLRALPHFLRNMSRYNNLNRNESFSIRLGEVWYRSHDRFLRAGAENGHYLHQDLWAARYLHDGGTTEHVDVGSRLDGFIAHILPFCRVRYIDIRPLDTKLAGCKFVQGSLAKLPLEDNSVPSLSCLHVIEHVGLGRYGDPVDPEGYLKAARELARVLSPGGNAHRIFDPQTVADAFRMLTLKEFHLIDDIGEGIIRNASFDDAVRCGYGCGLFVFEKETDHGL